jgi:hypothetical protein
MEAAGVLVVIVAVAFGFGGLIGWLIGRTKGRGGLGLVLGAILGVIGWLIVALLPRTAANEAAHYREVAQRVGSDPGPTQRAVVEVSARQMPPPAAVAVVVFAGIGAVALTGMWFSILDARDYYVLVAVASVFVGRSIEGFADPFARFSPPRVRFAVGGLSAAAAVAFGVPGVTNEFWFWWTRRTPGVKEYSEWILDYGSTLLGVSLLAVGALEIGSWLRNRTRGSHAVPLLSAVVTIACGLLVVGDQRLSLGDAVPAAAAVYFATAIYLTVGSTNDVVASGEAVEAAPAPPV